MEETADQLQNLVVEVNAFNAPGGLNAETGVRLLHRHPALSAATWFQNGHDHARGRAGRGGGLGQLRAPLENPR